MKFNKFNHEPLSGDKYNYSIGSLLIPVEFYIDVNSDNNYEVTQSLSKSLEGLYLLKRNDRELCFIVADEFDEYRKDLSNDEVFDYLDRCVYCHYLTDEQDDLLRKCWFIYGNNGRKHTHANHVFIQTIIERGIYNESEISEWKHNARVEYGEDSDKYKTSVLSGDCVTDVRGILFGE